MILKLRKLLKQHKTTSLIELSNKLKVSLNKIKNSVRIPERILKKREYSKKCLKGLFETDGHYGLSKKNYVEYIQFCNECTFLKKSVFDALGFLKYSPS